MGIQINETNGILVVHCDPEFTFLIHNKILTEHRLLLKRKGTVISKIIISKCADQLAYVEIWEQFD